MILRMNHMLSFLSTVTQLNKLLVETSQLVSQPFSQSFSYSVSYNKQISSIAPSLISQSEHRDTIAHFFLHLSKHQSATKKIPLSSISQAAECFPRLPMRLLAQHLL